MSVLIGASTPEKTSPCHGISLFTTNPYAQRIIRDGDITTPTDIKVLHVISLTGLPSYYAEGIKAIIPEERCFRFSQEMWKRFREPLRHIIARVGPMPRSNGLMNSATTVENLLIDARIVAGQFAFLVRELGKRHGGEVFLGNLIKSLTSINSRIQRIQASGGTVEYAVRQVDDVVRATVAFKTVLGLQQAVKCFIEEARRCRLAINGTNLWETEEDYAGYLDIDFTIRIPLASGGFVLGELQFHLDTFYDGTPSTAVARSHKVYEVMRMIPTGENPTTLTQEELREASRLFFITAMIRQFSSK